MALLFCALWLHGVDVARRDFYKQYYINCKFKADNQPHKASSGIHSGRKSVCIRVIRAIRVLSFFDSVGSFVSGGCVGSYRAPGL